MFEAPKPWKPRTTYGPDGAMAPAARSRARAVVGLVLGQAELVGARRADDGVGLVGTHRRESQEQALAGCHVRRHLEERVDLVGRLERQGPDPGLQGRRDLLVGLARTGEHDAPRFEARSQHGAELSGRCDIRSGTRRGERREDLRGRVGLDREREVDACPAAPGAGAPRGPGSRRGRRRRAGSRGPR